MLDGFTGIIESSSYKIYKNLEDHSNKPKKIGKGEDMH